MRAAKLDYTLLFQVLPGLLDLAFSKWYHNQRLCLKCFPGPVLSAQGLLCLCLPEETRPDAQLLIHLDKTDTGQDGNWGSCWPYPDCPGQPAIPRWIDQTMLACHVTPKNFAYRKALNREQSLVDFISFPYQQLLGKAAKIFISIFYLTVEC